jgi:hypothetical protein
MRNIIAFAFAFICLTSFGQDTTEIYVINKTNKLTKIDDTYSFFYRDMKYMKEIRELKFDSKDDALAFFEKAYKVLDTDVDLITKGYSLMRNNLSKNVLKLRNKDGGYFLIKRSSLDHMKAAVEKT